LQPYAIAPEATGNGWFSLNSGLKKQFLAKIFDLTFFLKKRKTLFG